MGLGRMFWGQQKELEIISGIEHPTNIDLFLFILEDLHSSGEISEEVYKRSRKRILDYGNDTIRELEEDLSSFDINLK